MAKKYAGAPKRFPELPHSDNDGNKVHNEILLSLPREEREIIFSKLEFVRLTALSSCMRLVTPSSRPISPTAGWFRP